MKEFKLYEPGYVLKDNEYLLKISDGTGFLCKLSKDGSLMKSFVNWPKSRLYGIPEKVCPIYLFEETYRTGWKLLSWRFGMSQNWATLRHPEGFTVEIYLQQFLEIIRTHTLEKGEIIGSFKWEDKKLLEQK